VCPAAALGYALSCLNIPVVMAQQQPDRKPRLRVAGGKQATRQAALRKARQTRKQPAKQWHQIVQDLERDPNHLLDLPSPSAAFQHFVRDSIARAAQAVRADPAWRESGLAELLQRSAALAEQDPIAARHAAVELLDYKSIAERARSGAFRRWPPRASRDRSPFPPRPPPRFVAGAFPRRPGRWCLTAAGCAPKQLALSPAPAAPLDSCGAAAACAAEARSTGPRRARGAPGTRSRCPRELADCRPALRAAAAQLESGACAGFRR
jgi:hypothetical protein